MGKSSLCVYAYLVTFVLVKINFIMESIFITRHKLKNYAGFGGEHEIKFISNDPTLILGINGAGKTSLLNSVYTSILSSLAQIVAFNYKQIQIISPSFIHAGKAESEFKSNFLIKTLNEDDDDDYELEYTIGLNNTFRENGRNFSKLGQFFKHIYEGNNQKLPIFRFFRSDKIITDNHTVVSNHTYNKLENRLAGYDNSYLSTFSIQEITTFIIEQINIENQEKVERKDLSYNTKIGNYIRTTLNLFTSILYNEKVEVKVGKSKYSNGQSLIINKNSEQLEFRQLSSGEKYVFAIILELIYRNTSLNPNQKDYRNIPGIVLIDELESHLHPRWQLTILKALQKCFPKVQFIVSSHSPLIASSVRKNQIIALNNFEIIDSDNLPDIYSGTADELLKKLLFADTHISDFDSKRKEIDILLNQLSFDLANKKLEQLKESVKSNPKWIKDYERRITFGRL